jgi:hypothetical protein
MRGEERRYGEKLAMEMKDVGKLSPQDVPSINVLASGKNFSVRRCWLLVQQSSNDREATTAERHQSSNSRAATMSDKSNTARMCELQAQIEEQETVVAALADVVSNVYAAFDALKRESTQLHAGKGNRPFVPEFAASLRKVQVAKLVRDDQWRPPGHARRGEKVRGEACDGDEGRRQAQPAGRPFDFIFFSKG